MSITVTSTTDSADVVLKAQGGARETAPEVKAEAAEMKADEVKEPAADEKSAESVEASEPDKEEKEEQESKEDKPKKKGGFEKRIKKLSAKLSQAEEEREYWRLQALKKPGQEESEKKPNPSVIAQAGERPRAEDFEKHEQYVEALAGWKVEQKISEREQKTKEQVLKSEIQSKYKAHLDRVEKYAKQRDDWDESIHGLDDIPISPAIQEAIVDSEYGPELMYELSKNPEEYEQICQMPANRALRELGRIEAKLSEAKSSSKETAAAKASKAPPPINPVGSKSSGSTKSPEDMSLTEYRKWREAQAR